MARVKPSLAASLRRRSSWPTLLSSPERPTSPISTSSGETGRRWVPDLHHSLAAHLDHAHFVGRAESVPHAPEKTVLVESVPFEVEHYVHHVFEHARACDCALLGNVADQEHRDVAQLGE